MQRNPNRTRYPVRNTRSLSRASTSWRHTTNQGNAEGSTDVTSDPLGHPEASRTRTPNRQQPAGIHDANFQPYSYIDNSRGGIINNTINTIQQDNSRTTKNELLSRSCTRATFTGEIRAVKLKCHPETRKSIISDIEGPWRVSLDGSPGILMLTGPVGTGKSTIALQVCNDLNNEHPRLLIGTFFFWRNDGDRNSLKCFVATIAYRIAVVMPEVGRIMEDIISRDPSILDSTIEHQWNSLVIEPLCRALAGVLPCATHRPLIVIDGLDECKSSSDHQQLLQLLITFLEHGLGKWFAFLVASRPESHITSEVEYLITQRPSYFRSPSLMLAETEESRADMKLILDTRFNGIYHRRRLVIGSHQWPPSGAVEHIIDLSKGQFIYVLTIVRWLEDDDGDPIRRLQVIFDASNDEKARAFAPLDMLYNLILESATSKEAGYLVVPCLALIIGFGEWKIALLGNSLLSDVPEDDDSDIQEVGSSYTTNIHSVKELAAFWNKAPEFIFLTLQPLHSVLQLLPCDKDHDTRDVAFFHTSFSEYLQNPLRSQTYNITDPKVLNSLVIQALNLASEPRGFLLPFPFFWMLIPSAGAFIMITEDLLAALSNFNCITWFQESFMFLAQYEEGLEQHLKSMYEEKFIPWLKSSLPEERQVQ
ncbi:hypothetical protein AX16_003777 [Volvariella volvacea WC 439]|nr:hypothetical protein AX16_003777 [Volvariella volvacea WC 439]